MKNALWLACVLVILPVILFSQTATAPPTGDGSSGNPYQIASLENLYWIAQNSSAWSNYFIQTANINASETSGWFSGAGWTPIDTLYGTYDGNGHTINGLYINGANYIGLFKFIANGATVKKLGMTNLNIYGGAYVAGFAAQNYGTIVNCYASGTVSGSYWVGGLVGMNMWSGLINQTYSHVNVSGFQIAGSLAGQNYSGGNILNSYATGSATASTYYAGGLVGSNDNGTITNSFSTGKVTGPEPIGGLNSYSGTSTNCFWDTISSGISHSEGGTGKSTADMQTQSTFTDAGWNFDDVWIMMGTNYPTLRGMPDCALQTALCYDGSDDYAIAPYSSTFNPSIFTYELWTRVDGVIGSYQSPLSTRLYDGNTSGINFYFYSDKRWAAWMGTGPDTWNSIASDTIEIGAWAFLTLTYDGTTARFYVNGALQGSLDFTYVPNTSGPLTFGCINESGPTWPFNGAIDEVRIWTVARDSAQIADDMGTVFTILPDHLVGYWQCNEGSGSAAYDVITGTAAALTNFNFSATSGWIPSDIPVDIILPVELTRFTSSVHNNAVTLAWNTATEVNNHGFEIERKQIPFVPAGHSPFVKGKTSEASGGFNKIGFVSGSGNSNSPKSYSFIDNSASGTVIYRLKQIDNDGRFTYSQEIEVTAGATPVQFALNQNYPNPFNPTTTIMYALPKDDNVLLKIYDIVGREVMTLVDGNQTSGSHTVSFDASKFASGMYIYKLVSGNFSAAKKMSLMK